MLKKYLILPLFFLLFSGSSIQASHFLGAGLSYTCVNNCTIRVEFRAYRDCSGSGIISPNPFTFTTQNPNCSPPVPLNNWPANPVVAELTPLCPGYSPTTCTDPNAIYPGVEEHYYEREYDICSSPGCLFTLVWSTCCRNPGITNIANASSSSVWLGSTTLNTNLPTCNSSPVFAAPPVSYLCTGQSKVIQMGATDPDGDSLVYSLGPCFSFSNTPIVFNSGYSASQPLGPSWSVFFNSSNGELTATALPGNAEVANICVYVEEYRNGVLLNTISRDYVIFARPCPNVFCGNNYGTGKVYKDENSNCVADPSEIQVQGMQIMALPDSTIVPTNSNGEFWISPLPGTYTFVQIPPASGLWLTSCPSPPSYTVTFNGINDTIQNLDFGMEAIYDCPMMWVDIAAIQLRPCFNSVFYINYCNQGTDTAYNAYIDVILDTNYSYLSSSIPLSGSNGSTFTFNLGDLGIGDCGFFILNATLACDSTLVGTTLCATAHAYPDTFCLPLNPVWDMSSVEVVSACVGDSLACFTVSNSGSPTNGNMQGPTDWRLYENGILATSGTVQLCGGCDTTMCFPANGNTLRLEVDQRPGHPGNSHPNTTLEGCGQPNSAPNLVNIFPQDDADPFISIDCGVATNAVDPNSKYVYPSGVDTAFHYIDESDELEYKIDFQNEGTADAITVRLVDTLSPRLDITTVVPGASSHAYSWEILPYRRLQFTFNNINLPPLSQDSLGSIGFVKFKIKQMPGNQMGDRIENFADIFFDFNAPIRTNTVFNTIGWPVVIGLGAEPVAAEVKIFPNPSTGEFFAEVTGLEAGHRLSFEVFSLVGQRVLAGGFETGQRYRADLSNSPAGVYIYRILDGERLVKAGKLLLE